MSRSVLDRPLLIYDGDCGFCRAWVERWRVYVAGRVDFAAAENVRESFPQVPDEAYDESAVLIRCDGSVVRGSRAVVEALSHAPGRRWMLAAYLLVPGAAKVVDPVYDWIAGHRMQASRISRVAMGSDVRPERIVRVRRLFIRGLSFVYLCAFASLWVQIDGLLGSDGISPVAGWLEMVRERLGPDAIERVPTIFWLGAGDAVLRSSCLAGIVLAIATAVGLLPRLSLAVLWCLYLSICTTGDVFLGYQWDALLLETGLLAIFFAPPSRRGLADWSARSPRIALWLLRWLLFRLLLLSGIVKLLSGDPAWSQFRALHFHYFTQPLPVWTSYYAHFLPSSIHTLSVWMTFAIELAAPWLIFGTRRTRRLAFSLILLLQVAIGATGNYGFFNLLTVVLALVLLDDALIERWTPRGRSVSVSGSLSGSESRESVPLLGWGRALRTASALAAAAFVLFVSCVQIQSRLVGHSPGARWMRDAVAAVAPLRSINVYGLFAVMTTDRPEILLEGSPDGVDWEPYEFVWKPGSLDRRPEFAGAHMPRLDWQMWFAALGRCETNPWFHRFMIRLLQGSPAVSRLLERDPFPDEPPRFLRSTLYYYNFVPVVAETSPAETGLEAGAWWQRRRVRPYCPVVSFEDGVLRSHAES